MKIAAHLQERSNDLGKKCETKIAGVFASTVGKECYQVIRTKFAQGIAVVPFVYLATDNLDEAVSEANNHPDKSVHDMQGPEMTRE